MYDSTARTHRISHTIKKHDHILVACYQSRIANNTKPNTNPTRARNHHTSLSRLTRGVKKKNCLKMMQLKANPTMRSTAALINSANAKRCIETSFFFPCAGCGLEGPRSALVRFWSGPRELLRKNSTIFATFFGLWSPLVLVLIISSCKNSGFSKIWCNFECQNS